MVAAYLLVRTSDTGRRTIATSGKGRGGRGRAAPKPSAATLATEQADALKLRLDGLSVREIGVALGLPSSTVQDRLTAAQTELVAPLADEVRLLELARLDRWQNRLEKRLADDEDPVRVIPVALKVQERRSRYLGLDAPERQEIVSASLGTDDPVVLDTLARARELAAERLADLKGTE